MSKLIFEDNDGEQFEIKLNSINVTDMPPGSILVPKIFLTDGKPPDEISNLIDSVSDLFEDVLPEDVSVMPFVIVDNYNNVEFELFKKRHERI
jgi:hypothetical protein